MEDSPKGSVQWQQQINENAIIPHQPLNGKHEFKGCKNSVCIISSVIDAEE